MTKSRKKAEWNGRMAEHLVALFYRIRGYRLLHRRYRCHGGEIDLIMTRRSTFAFIEVKWRARADTPLDAVLTGPRQRRRIRAAASHFLAGVGMMEPVCRFDTVILSGWLNWLIYADTD